MRIRTFVAILAALVLVVLVAYFNNLNSDLLTQEFRLGTTWTAPLFVVLLAVFLLGFLPPVTVLMIKTVERDLAQRRARRLNREAKSIQASYRRAIDFQADGQWGRAAAELEAVLGEQPEDFSALLRYGAVLRHLGRGEEALEMHRRASVLYPQSVAVLFELAEDYENEGRSEVAHEIRNRVWRDFPDVGLKICRRRRNAALGESNWKEATRWQERIDALVNGGASAEELEQEEAIRRGLAYQQAVSWLEQDRIPEATAELERILAEESRFIPAAIMLGEAEILAGRPERAVERWRSGYESTGSPVFLQRIEDHFIDRSEPIEAIETLRRLIAEAENDLLPRFFLVRLYYRLEMHEKALKVLDGVRDRIQFSPTVHFLQGRIHERRGESEAATASFIASVQQAGIDRAEYACRLCDTRYPEWHDRCGSCGSWNSVDLDFKEESVSAEDLGVRPAPVWTVYDDGREGA